jgi:cobyrinic acid a,c-diamide synthase
MTKAILVAAPRSGAGKTTVTLGLLAAFRQRGLRVVAAKAGPDYIDPAFHEAATGAPCCNLDSWAMPPKLLDSIFSAACQGADLLIIEAAMGLFDGVVAAPGRTGRAADLASRYGLPVVLVLDVTGQSQSAAAVARGFAQFDPDVVVAGVVLNRVGSERHRQAVATALAAAGIAVFGALPRDAGFSLPERHLGLVQAAEQTARLPAHLAYLADSVAQRLDLDALWTAAKTMEPRALGVCALRPFGQIIAVAKDVAFSFCYPHILLGWQAAGAQIRFFSPLANEAPPDDADACWLPGGYPELHGETLSAADHFLAGMRRFATTRPVHGECGGYMVLGRMIEDAAGRAHPMLGLLDHATSFARPRLHLGYREALLMEDGVFGKTNSCLRGHEFHYASVIDAGTDSPFASLRDAAGVALGLAGGQRGRVSGSFFHLMAQI